MAKSVLPVSFRIQAEIKAAAEKAAADDHRSLSSLIEKVLADYLKERGYLAKPAEPASAPKPTPATKTAPTKKTRPRRS